jgi:hypothetical protein
VRCDRAIAGAHLERVGPEVGLTELSEPPWIIDHRLADHVETEVVLAVLGESSLMDEPSTGPDNHAA